MNYNNLLVHFVTDTIVFVCIAYNLSLKYHKKKRKKDLLIIKNVQLIIKQLLYLLKQFFFSFLFVAFDLI